MTEKFGENPEEIDTTTGGQWIENQEGILEFKKDEETHEGVESVESSEVVLPEVDNIVRRTASDLELIDKIAHEGHVFPEEPSAVIGKYKKLTGGLEGKNPQELLSIVNQKGKINPDEFSYFHIEEKPIGCIHIDLGNSEDLERFRENLMGKFQQILEAHLGGGGRGMESFEAMYFDPHSFGKDSDYLGVVVTVRDKFKNNEDKENTLNHEYSHAVTYQVIRPECQNKVIDLNSSSISDNIKVLKGMGKEEVDKLAKHLGVEPAQDTPKHLYHLMIASNLKREQNLLDEMKAYSFNLEFLPAKFRTTSLNFEDYDIVEGAGEDTAKKYFKVLVLYDFYQLLSEEAKKRALAIIGSSLSLDQAKRLLQEEDLVGLKYSDSEDDEKFLERIRFASKFIKSKDFLADFTDDKGNELILSEKVKDTIIRKEKIDEQIEKRWGSIKKAPPEFVKIYKTLFE